MTFKESVASAAAALNARTVLLDVSGPGTIKVYDNTAAAPASLAAAIDGSTVHLGTLTLAATAFAVTTGNTATAAAIVDDSSADATGTALFYRAFDGAGTARFQGDITVSGGGDMELNTLAIVAGATIEVSTWTITQPLG